MDELVHDVDGRLIRREIDGARASVKRPIDADVAVLLAWVGNDPLHPARVVRANGELFAGDRRGPAKILGAVFEDGEGHDEMVLVRDISSVSDFEHHTASFLPQSAYRLFSRGRRGGLVQTGPTRRPDRARRGRGGQGRGHVHVDSAGARAGRAGDNRALPRSFSRRSRAAGSVFRLGEGMMCTATVEWLQLGGATALDLDAPLTIMRSFRRRGVSVGHSPRSGAASGPKEGEQARVQGNSAEVVVPTPALLHSWLRAVAQSQDREAFARLHGFFAPRLTTFLSRAGLSRSQTEDLVQEAMFTVWRKAALYNPSQGAVSTWVFVIARNLRVDHLRRKANRETLPLDDWDQIDDGPTGEEEVLAAERENRVRAALSQLSPEQAQIVEKAYFAEKPQSEIARELGVPLGTVKSRVRLALARLRKLLEDAP